MLLNNVVLLFLVSVIFTIPGIYSYPNEFGGFNNGGNRRNKCGAVHLTVSSQETYLELNWITDCQLPDKVPDYVVLTHHNLNDRGEDSAALVKIRTSDYPEGYYRSKVKFGHPWLPGNWELSDDFNNHNIPDPGPHCYPYWISSVTGNNIMDTDCLAIQPTWMSDNRARLGPQRIGSLLIPGTHNSGSFGGVPKFLENYILNQDRSVWTQLVHGIRYLDLRIGYYENEGFFVNHDRVRINKVVPVFRQIRKFVEMSPREIIVVDFHRFPYPSNFTTAMHRNFVQLVWDNLGDLAVPPGGLQVGKGPSLNEIWAQNKNLVICYAEKSVAREHYWLWQPVQQHWANTKSVSNLKNFIWRSLRDQHRMSINPMFALMAELTPQPIDLIFRTNNLRKLAHEVNRQVTKWFRDEWPRDTNIVASDYFLGNDIVNVAIDVNTNR